MRLIRTIAAMAVALTIAVAAPAVATTHHARVHPAGTVYVDDTFDILSVEANCAGFDAHPVVNLAVGLHRSSVRTTNLTYDATISWTSNGSQYSGALLGYSVAPNGSSGFQAWLTTDGPIVDDNLVNAAHVLPSATNIIVSITRHSDGELEYYGRPANISTACS